ncbi:MAG: M23 family metallopeptidase [Candidatus Eisenbacteria bacterium]|nr:M23 family metallopeptidase [Candidatus Eisenbacteria bacterium]
MTHCLALVFAVFVTKAPVDRFPMRDGFVQVAVDDAGQSEIGFFTADGRLVSTARRPGFRSPQVAPGGMRFAFLSGDRIVVTDGEGRIVGGHPAGAPFAVSIDGRVAVARERTIEIHGGAAPDAIGIPAPAVGLTWDAERLLVATARAVFLLDQREPVPVFTVAAGERITWLGSTAGVVGCIVQGTDEWSAWRVRLCWDGMVMRRGPPERMPLPPLKPATRGIPWPFLPDTLPPIGNSYGEYQNYGGFPYRHPGVDFMGAHYEPVYAVAPGVVKAVLTTSGSYHWRVAVGDSAGPGPCQGWLYAHLDLLSIAVSVGDTVAQGDFLGTLVPWPVADFTHLHFARITATGTAWNGEWLCTGNPLLLADDVVEGDAPFLLEANGALLAFCRDNTSTYLPAGSLTGLVDIIAHVGDRTKSPWVLCAHEIRYHIYPQGRPLFPVVNDRCAVYFNHEIDVYQGGAFDELIVPVLWKHDAVCPTAGDYDTREFYHILTNCDGDSLPEVTDEAHAFNTGLHPDGAYVVRVTVRDAAGNVACDSMTVTLANGNPPLALEGVRSGHDLLLSWRRMSGATGYLVYQVPAAFSVGGGRPLASVADTCFLVREAFLTGSEGYYRVVATDIRGRPAVFHPTCDTGAP